MANKKIETQPVHEYFYRWVNCWADVDKHKFKTHEEKMAYHEAISDIYHLITCPNAYPLNEDELKDEYYHD